MGTLVWSFINPTENYKSYLHLKFMFQVSLIQNVRCFCHWLRKYLIADQFLCCFVWIYILSIWLSFLSQVQPGWKSKSCTAGISWSLYQHIDVYCISILMLVTPKCLSVSQNCTLSVTKQCGDKGQIGIISWSGYRLLLEERIFRSEGLHYHNDMKQINKFQLSVINEYGTFFRSSVIKY